MNTLAMKWAQLNPRDRRALQILAPAVLVILLVYLVVFPALDSMDEAARSIPIREKTLRKYRALARLAPARENDAKSFDALLAQAEQGLLASRTAPLAGAEVQQVLRDQAAAAGIQIRSVDFLPARKVGEGGDYALASVSTQFTARMEQVVALLSGIQSHPRTLTVEQLRITTLGDLTKKQVVVSLVLAGAAPGEIVAPAVAPAAPKGGR